MKGPWKALAFLAAVAGTAFVLSTSAFALGGHANPAPQWKPRLGTATWSGRLAALYPGVANDTEIFPLTVTNTARSVERLHSISVSLVTRAGDAVTAGGADIRGCRASWFTISLDPHNRALPLKLASEGSYTGRIDLAMRDSGTDQNACERGAPAFTVTAS